MITPSPPKTSQIVAVHFLDNAMTWAQAYHDGACWREASDGRQITGEIAGWSLTKDARAARRYRMVMAGFCENEVGRTAA